MQRAVPARNVVVAVIDSRAQAEECVELLRQAGCNGGKLSIVAKDVHPEEKAAADAFWTAMRERLSGWTVLALPRMGTVMAAGPLGGWIATALENEAVFGGFSALGAALYSLGIAKGATLRYEAAVQAGRILAIVHGAAGELGKAREILAASAATSD